MPEGLVERIGVSGSGQSSGSKMPTLPMKQPPAISSQAHMP